MSRKKEQRRQAILELLCDRQIPVSGADLARIFGVSRQVIVQDIAALKTECPQLQSTPQGYWCPVERFKAAVHVFHQDDQITEELNLICDNGGCAEDVFIDHPVYGRLTAPLHLHNRREIAAFRKMLQEKEGQPLTMLTGGDHWHTISAPDQETLDAVCRELKQAGFLLEELQDDKDPGPESRAAQNQH